MPKDPKKNVDRYKIDGGHLNEYEFQENQQRTATQEKSGKRKEAQKVDAKKRQDAKKRKGRK